MSRIPEDTAPQTAIPDPAPDIRVHVQVTYLTGQSTPERRVFSYVIRIENRSDQTWQLLTRHWDIVDGRGHRVSVDGDGVVGEQPVLSPGAVYVYDSFVTVEATPGQMSGHYTMQDAWGTQVQVPIPGFMLERPGERTLH